MSASVVPADAHGIAEAARTLASGGLVAFPTETVYGLGADATSAAAVEAVFEAKGRPRTDPLIVHVATIADADAVGDLDAHDGAARRLAAAFWPGPLTTVVQRRGGVVASVGAGRPTVAIRCPAHPVALELIAGAGVPVAAPSANRFGRVSPTAAAHVVDELGDRIDIVLDAGPTPLGVESTVVEFGDGPPRLLRPGGLPLEDLLEVAGDIVVPERLVVDGTTAQPGPGMLVGHYAPQLPLVLVEGAGDVLAGLLDELRARDVDAAVLELADGDAGARELYARLRALDGTGAEVVLAPTVPPEGLGRAVNDRLFRAAHGHIAAEANAATVQRILGRLGR